MTPLPTGRDWRQPCRGLAAPCRVRGDALGFAACAGSGKGRRVRAVGSAELVKRQTVAKIGQSGAGTRFGVRCATQQRMHPGASRASNVGVADEEAPEPCHEHLHSPLCMQTAAQSVQGAARARACRCEHRLRAEHGTPSYRRAEGAVRSGLVCRAPGGRLSVVPRGGAAAARLGVPEFQRTTLKRI